MSVLTPHYHWIVPAPHPVTDAAIADARRRGLSARAMRVLSRRGPVDPADLGARFDPPELGLHDPMLLPDAEVVLARVEQAMEGHERVLVLGDFDADGLCGLTILAEALRWLGVGVDTYVPDRSAEGHGLSRAAVQRAREGGHRLIVTADTGSSSTVEIAEASASGIDVIVTDHHVLPSERPRALALVNPQRPESRYPDARLSGSGVAFKVAQLLLASRAGGVDAALALSDLAAIGSVADVVPLVGENRCIVRLGLARLAGRSRPGLAALTARSGLDGSAGDRTTLTVDDIAFRLAPRINAMGRVGDPTIAAALLSTHDRHEAERLADELEGANAVRRQWMLAGLAEARALVEAGGTIAEAPFLVVAGDWPVGIVGLIAGRLADELGRPALVISTQVDPWRGSARSAGGFDVARAFDACADLFERHGGHPAAAGCHVQAAHVGALRERLVALVVDHPPRDRRPSLTLDLVQSGTAADHVLLRELAPLEDAAEAPPVVGFAGLVVSRARLASGGHTQITLRKGRDVVDGIGFGRADLAEQLVEGQVVDVAAHLGSRTFAGLETLQLEIRDVAPAGHLAGMRARAVEATDPTRVGWTGAAAGGLMTDRMSGQQGPLRSPSGGGRTPGGMPAPGVAFGSAATSPVRIPSSAAPRPPSASGTLRGRTGPPRDPRYPGPAMAPHAPLAPRPRATVRGPLIAPVLALVGLIAIGGASVWGISLLGAVGAGAEPSPTPLLGVLVDPSPGADGLVEESFAPDEGEPSLAPVLVTPPPDERASIRGTTFFVRDGEIHAASGLDIRKLTSDQFDSSPTWSPDGKWIYFIRTRVRSTNQTRETGKYTFYIPILMRMAADGDKRAKGIYDSLIKGPNGLWFSHLLQPDVSPDGKTIAVVSDGPSGTGPVVLHTLSSKGGKLRKASARTFGDLGDNDPAWSPDGRHIAFTHNRRQGNDGAPALTILNRRTGKTKALKNGYAHPSWAPDGSWLAAELTTGTGRDIVLLDAARGDERARLTTDGDSFAPVVSPDGDQVAYLRRDGPDIDLRVATLAVDDQVRSSLVDDRPVTDDGWVDASSSPAWFIPEEERVPEADDALADPDALQARAAD